MTWYARNGINRRRWQRVRRRVLQRDGYRCRQCGKAGRLEVDHVTPVSQGGARYDDDNLRTLCRSHHVEKSRAENRRRHLTPAQANWQRFVAELEKVT